MGGTATAIKLAWLFQMPVLNLGRETVLKTLWQQRKEDIIEVMLGHAV